MQKKIVVLAGLPRSGSTVLASILNQNTTIAASANSPLVEVLVNVDHHLRMTEQARASLQATHITNILQHIITGFYAHTERTVIFDKSRAWPQPHNLAVLARSTEQPVICIAMVRDIPSIVSSFLRKIHAYPDVDNYIDRALLQANRPRTDWERAHWLLSPGGTVYESYHSLKSGFDSKWHSHINCLEYDDLVAEPEQTLRTVYDIIDEPYFQHDFEAINNVTPEDDTVYGIPGLHEIRSQLRKTAPDPRRELPPELYAECSAVDHFWRATQTGAVTQAKANPLHISTINAPRI